MSASRKLLLVSGLLLAIWAMTYGLWYAMFAEHQHLEGMGASLARAFTRAAERNIAEAHAAIGSYAEIKFAYVRHVDVHSHWGGLALLLIIFGAIFDRLGFEERMRFWLAAVLLAGSVIFPLGVILQVVDRSWWPTALAMLGSGMVTVALAFVAWGFARRR
jgi:hypothetical protein